MHEYELLDKCMRDEMREQKEKLFHHSQFVKFVGQTHECILNRRSDV